MPVISAITRTSLHDGDGIRSVVYVAGCSLHCAWCHNPEAMENRVSLLVNEEKCIGCGRCVSLCPACHQITGNGRVFLRKQCRSCMKCAARCPSGALSPSGKNMTAQEVFTQIIKDKPYFDESGGGVTFSGGECLLQSDFVKEVSLLCHMGGISTAVETALYVPYENVQAVLPYTDRFFADCKLPQAEKHRQYTGADNALILSNLKRLLHSHPAVTVRIPLIPSVNDTQEDIRAFAAIFNRMDARFSVELLRYNPLAEGKYRLLGRSYIRFAEEPQSKTRMDEIRDSLASLLHEGIAVFYRI